MQMARVLTPQKPIQRERFGKLPEGLPGSTLERGRRGEKRQERGRPVRFRLREGSVARHTDLEPHKGKPGYGRRPEPTRHGERPQPVSRAEQKRGGLKTSRESDHLIVLGGRESRPRGEGGDGETEPAKETWAGQEGPEYPSQPPCREERDPGHPGVRQRVSLRSPVRENRTPGSVRGASGNRRPYRDARD